MRKIFKPWVFFFILVFLLSTDWLFALDFQIDQAKVRIKMPPGWSDGGVVKVENRSSEPITIRVYAGDWVYTNQDGSKNFLPAGSQLLSCAEWIKFYPSDFTLAGHKTQNVNFVVAIPPDAVGGHYAVLFFETRAGVAWDQAKGAMVKVYNRLASLFYVEPEGTIKRQANLSDFEIKESTGNIEVKAIFHNIGNVDITAKGTFDIIDESGFVFTRGQFDDVYTLPQDKAKLYAKSPVSKFPKGKYDVVLTFDLEGGVLVREYQIEISDSGRIVNIQEMN